MSFATFFESAIVQVPASVLRPMSALAIPVWGGCRLIEPADVWAAVQAGHYPVVTKLMPLSNQERESFNSACSYEDHVQRIAWLVAHWDESTVARASQPDSHSDWLAQSESPILLRLDDRVATFEDGNHRVVAAILRDEPRVTVHVSSGHTSLVTQRLGDVTWLSQPKGALFGKNIVACDTGESWEVDCISDRLWINNRLGYCQVQLKLGGLFSSARITSTPDGSGPTRYLVNEELSLDALVAGCAELVSPVFGQREFAQFLQEQFPTWP